MVVYSMHSMVLYTYILLLVLTLHVLEHGIPKQWSE